MLFQMKMRKLSVYLRILILFRSTWNLMISNLILLESIRSVLKYMFYLNFVLNDFLIEKKRWHVGSCSMKYTPVERGFDSFYGFFYGEGDYYSHRRNNLKKINPIIRFISEYLWHLKLLISIIHLALTFGINDLTNSNLSWIKTEHIQL